VHQEWLSEARLLGFDVDTCKSSAKELTTLSTGTSSRAWRSRDTIFGSHLCFSYRCMWVIYGGSAASECAVCVNNSIVVFRRLNFTDILRGSSTSYLTISHQKYCATDFYFVIGNSSNTSGVVHACAHISRKLRCLQLRHYHGLATLKPALSSRWHRRREIRACTRMSRSEPPRIH
jgi:hypothetical protein